MKKPKKFQKISRQIEKKKWKHANEVAALANAPLNQTLLKLKIPTIGLSDKWIQKREENQFKITDRKDRFHFFLILLKNLKEPFTLILLAISVYSFIMFGLDGDLTYIVGGLVVVVLVAFSIVVDLIAKYAMHKDNQKLKQTNRETVKVLRNAKISSNLNIFGEDEAQLIEDLIEIDYHNLLVGDLIFLKSGDIVPADAKIIYDKDGVTVDQELLTGTKNGMTKKSFNSSLSNNIFSLTNVIFRGTKVVHGNLWALVLYKGSNTYYEFFKKNSIDKKEKTVFNTQTKSVTRFLVTAICVFAPIIFVLALVLAGLRDGFKDSQVWVDSIIFGMTIVICLTPDSLPLSLTSAFSRTRKVLANKKIISRDITAAQNIGAMDVLAIDMQNTFVNKEYVLDDFVNLNNQPSNEVLKWATLSYLSSPTQNLELENTLKKERRILQMEKSLVNDFQLIRKVNFLGAPRTYVSVVEDKNHQRWAILRGPKWFVLNQTNGYFNRLNQAKKINADHLNPVINKTFAEINQQGFWSIGVAIKKIKDNVSEDESEVLKPNYTYLGLINFVQTTVSGAKENIKELQKQALSLKYMSHEPLDQTLVLAKNLGFNVFNHLSGTEIKALSDRELSRKINTTNLFYNLDSFTETRVIKNFKKSGYTIGYLGRDLDDSFQLLNANIGITTHNSDVFAKQNANLIINDGNITDICEAIIKGREASINMVKFIKIRIAWAIAITIKLAVGLAWFNAQPMNSMELLTLNLIFDIVEFMVIFDRVDPRYIKKPVRWDIPSIWPFALWCGLIFQLVTFINVPIFIYVMEPGILNQVRNGLEGWETGLGLVQTIYWIDDIIVHLLFVLVMRTHYRIWFKDRPSLSLILAILFTGAFVILVPLIPTLNAAFTLETPDWRWWVFFIVLMIGFTFVMEIWKKTYVRIFNKWL